jgi:DNA repair protein RecO (recombination protein O)
MSSYNDKGFVIKISPLNENDKVIVLLSQYNGRVNAVAKGIKKAKSRNAGSLDLLNHVNMRVYQGKGAFDLLTEVKLICDFRNIKTDLDIINLNMYVLEVIDKTISGHEKNAPLYQLLHDYLYQQKHPTVIETLEYLTIFQIKLLDLLGYTPLLDSCIECGEPLLKDEERVPSENGQVGYICHKHLHSNLDYQSVSDVIIKIQRFIIDRSINSAQRLKVTPEHLKALFSIQHTWLQGIIEKKINTTDIINSILLKIS